MNINKWKLFYFIFILIGIILLMLSYTPRKKTIELFGLSKLLHNKSNSNSNSINNSIIGGTIITLQFDFTILLTQFDILEKNMEKTYSITDLTDITKDLSGNTAPTVTKLYNNIQNIKSGINALLNTDILQPVPTQDSKSTPIIKSNKTISNNNIKTDVRWYTEVKPLLTTLKTDLTTLLKCITEYLAIVPNPLPANITKELNEIINILTNMQLTIKTINGYITNILK